jgi:hypothetical protein
MSTISEDAKRAWLKKALKVDIKLGNRPVGGGNPQNEAALGAHADAASARGKGQASSSDPEGDLATETSTFDLLSIKITPETASVDPSEPLQLKATGVYDGAPNRDITNEVDWTSSNAAISIDAGKVSARPVDAAATITATDRINPKIFGVAKVTVIEAVRGMDTPFGTYHYFVAEEPKVKGRLTRAVEGYNPLEPMIATFEKQYEALDAAAKKVDKVEVVEKEVAKYTSSGTRTAAIQAEAQKQDLGIFQAFLQEMSHGLDEAGEQLEAAIDQHEAELDKKLAAENRGKSAELKEATHLFVNVSKAAIKGLVKLDPTYIIDIVGDFVELGVHQIDPWRKKAEELEKAATELSLNSVRTLIDVFRQRVDRLKEEIPKLQKELDAAKNFQEQVWKRSEELYDNDKDNKGRFRFQNVKNVMALAKSVVDMAFAMLAAEKIAFNAANDVSGLDVNPRLSSENRRTNALCIKTWVDTLRDMSRETVSKGTSAGGLLKEAQETYRVAKGVMSDPKRQ